MKSKEGEASREEDVTVFLSSKTKGGVDDLLLCVPHPSCIMADRLPNKTNQKIQQWNENN